MSASEETVDAAIQAAAQTPEGLSDVGESDTVSDSNAVRLAKMKALRRRLHESSQANRRDTAAESNKRRVTAQEAARLERKRQQAEVFQEKLEAAADGEDLERKKAWEYSIADNEAWDKKLARKARRAQFDFTDFDDVARRKYKRDIDSLKPDLKSYNAQRSEALGLTNGSASNEVATIAGSSSEVARANEMLYRDANSFVYADHKPTEEQIDKVIHKMNMDADKRNKFSRKRKQENEDVTYINEKNRQFNKKLARYFDKYTSETRGEYFHSQSAIILTFPAFSDNFERGTAL